MMSKLGKKRKYVQSSVQVPSADEGNVSTEKSTAKDLSKNKRNRFSYLRKQEILQESKYLTSNVVCEKYDITEGTLRRWKTQQDEISEASTKENLKNAKKARTTSKLDNQLHCWFLNAVQRRVPISGPILKQQAIVLNKKNGGSKDFRASNGWLDKWKRRMNVKNLKITVRTDKDVSKNKRNRFSYLRKQEILQESKNLTSNVVCEKYDITEGTLRRWKTQQDEISAASTKENLKNAKKARTTSELDNQLHCWFLNAVQRGIPISGPILKQQAIALNKESGGSKDFRASNGWLDKWKKRMNVKNLKIIGEELSADEVVARKYSRDFAILVKMYNLAKAQIFNMDKSGCSTK